MTDRELMQQALDALEWCYDVTEWPANGKSAQDKAIEALRARLAQPEQEPVAWVSKRTLDRIKDFDGSIYANGGFDDAVPLYTAPPQRAFTNVDDLIADLEKPEPVAWRNAAIRIGEELSSVGPDGYYSMTAEQWLDWAMAQEPQGKNRLYTAPPQREWQGLTDEEMEEAMKYWSDPCRSAYGGAEAADDEYVDMIGTWRHIEAKLKEKNT